jgi:type IV pilus assembly protein PilV
MQILSSRQRGATLIESLVSLVILAIAVIGMLGVQVRTLMETNTAAGRTQAMLLIEDLSERIKANPGGYGALSDYTFTEASTPPAASCNTTPCNSTALANWDKTQWLANLKATMPNAKVETFISQNNNAVTGNRQLGVLIGWTLRERDASLEPTKFEKAHVLDSAFSGAVNSTVNSGNGCWANYICHLAYIEP